MTPQRASANSCTAPVSPFPQAVVEVVGAVDDASSNVDHSVTALKVISGSEAFRKYNWLRDAPILNSAGDLRGMVVSANWRAAFQMTNQIGDAASKIGWFASFVRNLVRASSEVQAILKSQDSWNIKGARLSAQVTSISLRMLGAEPMFWADTLTLSLQGYCRLAGVASSRFPTGACVGGLSRADTYIQSTFDKVTDGDNIYMLISTNVAPR